MTDIAVRSHPVREYVKRVESLDIEEYPEWDLEKPLPKLPVPDLALTCDNYLRAARPVISDEQYDVTRKLVENFAEPGGEGALLQQKLREFAETTDNWAYEWWLNDMYMKPRFSLPVNSNPGMVFPRQQFADKDAQLRFTARLISGILDYKVIIDARSLPVDRCRHREKGQPLCMEQYYRLFSSYRVPGVNKDTQVLPGGNIMPEPEHIIVLCKNQFFVLEVIENFTRLDHDNLYTQLKRIVKQAEEEEKAPSVGILTAYDRESWAKARMHLVSDSTNQDCMDLIEGSIFILCLDDSIPLSWNHQSSIDETQMSMRDDVSLALQMLHGQGSRINSSNRWFDKTMQFVVGEDGNCGLCYEHSAAEGIAVVQLIEHLLKYMEEVRRRKLPRMKSHCELPYPRKLYWKSSPTLLNDIACASEQFDKTMEDVDLFVLRFTKFGREFPKTQNMSPDSFIQLALQLTYYKVHGRLVATYESASTRRFLLGRVDNIRAASCEALDWVKAMVGETETTDSEKMALLKNAMKRQTEIMAQTILGQGMDCHLLGLKEISQGLGRPMPAVFTDPTYTTMNQFTLSTSQVPTTMDAFMCYGPVVPDGYGVCYNPHNGYILVCVSAFHSSEQTNSEFFAMTLEGSFLQMYELCLKTNQSSPYDLASDRSAVNNNDLKMKSPAKSKLTHQNGVENDVTVDGTAEEKHGGL